MSSRQQKYKQMPIGFGNIQKGRAVRNREQNELRKYRRAEIAMDNRNGLDTRASVSQNTETEVPGNVRNRTSKLLTWRTERDKRKIMEEAKKVRPFVVGSVHHKMYSPVTTDEDVSIVKVQKQTVPLVPNPPSKRITKATEKRLLYKAQAKNVTPSTGLNTNGTKEQKVQKGKEQITVKKQEQKTVKKQELKTVKKQEQKTIKKQELKTIKKQEQKNVKKQDHFHASSNYNLKHSIGPHQRLAFGRTAIPLPIPTKKDTAPSLKTTRASRTGTTKFIVGDNHDQKHNALAMVDVEKDTHESDESSIETIKLNISSDENETFNISNDNDNKNNIIANDDENSNKEEEEHDKSCNNSVKESQIILNNSAKVTQSSSNNNTPTSADANSPNEPVFFSPYVVTSRGKSNARKEQQLKRGFSLNSSRNDNIPTKDTVMKNLNISIEEEERTAQYFQFLLNKEIDRLRELCEKWERVKTEATEITEDAQYQIIQAIGQTNLLITKKFERFRGLVSDCETGKGEMLVTCKDLQGFWDMMYMEVKNCDLRFEKLEQLCSRNWEEEEPSAIIKPLVKKKKIANKRVVPTKSSSIRAFLARNRRKQETSVENSIKAAKIISNKESINKHRLSGSSPNVKFKTRRYKSMDFNSHKRASLKRNGSRFTLLREVQLSESRKPPSSLNLTKVSCFNDTITPGKSILKQPKNSVKMESNAKTTHKVNFNDTVELNEVQVDEETQRKMDLATAFARIDSLDFDCPEENEAIHAERKLDFTNSSFLEMQDPEKENALVPTIQIQSATPLQESVSNNNLNASSRRVDFRRQHAIDENDEIFYETDKVFDEADKTSEETDKTSHETALLNTTISMPFVGMTDVADLNVLKEKSGNDEPVNDKEEVDNANESVKVLRTRTVITGNTPQPKRRYSQKLSLSVNESEHKENKTPLGTRRSSMRITARNNEKINSKIDLQVATDNLNLSEKVGKRRSKRNVKFSENEPVFPMTPHVRRSKVQSTETGRKSAHTEDDASVQTPKEVPARVRRSRNRKASSVDE
ncbi:uncharacterized protein LOC122403327 isoform X2 [Colletes gigas]|uniref:uncharacterized protein LOC122403327 isoform X2 n=1 Tax=Colletes gigas TaxID=935657 RepID=UPI001C9B0F77|nr:uncharacterized protein LOC122403327 isoform X2 [Colletes gigas]